MNQFIIFFVALVRTFFKESPAFWGAHTSTDLVLRKGNMQWYKKTWTNQFEVRRKNDIIFSGERNIIFPDNRRNTIFQCEFFGKTFFSEHFQKTLYFHVIFLRKIIFQFSSKEKDHIFGKKKCHQKIIQFFWY